jgi:hypothetical protein
MRFLVKVSMPVEAGNAAVKAGTLGTTIQSILADLKPEAVYFTDDNGQRTAFVFLEMQDASQIPAIAEPWFLAFNAKVEFHPVMVPDDLARAGAASRRRSTSTADGCGPLNIFRASQESVPGQRTNPLRGSPLRGEQAYGPDGLTR